MLSQEIRRKFLDYFKSKGHTIVPSSSVVPHEDPTLLFINAGMNQFKDVFLGKTLRDYKRATSSQKCIRVGGKHNDLDNVGHTARHLTFFEMLGNFSFGDYFKEQAIAYAWEVSTKVFGFPKEKLWITVYEEDEESFELWQAHVEKNRIVRMGKQDNFWEMGATGPCGPCSELYYDKGEAYGSASTLKEDVTGQRYLEFWNLVFMQFNRSATGQLQPLPNQSIDTGGGLERIVSLIMGVDSVFSTDILHHLIQKIEQVSGKKYEGSDPSAAAAFHVIADHLRALSFAIADGAQPSNIERGYVLRKLLRRAVRYGRTLGLQRPFLASILPALIETMGSDYGELKSANERIATILTSEEESFLRTLKKGGGILNTIVEKALASPFKQISGEEAFKLKDTYGFPLEEILLIAKDNHLAVNIDAYELLEKEAKEKSRSARDLHTEEVTESLFAPFVEKQGPTQFVGYSTTMHTSEIVALVKEGAFVERLSKGEEGSILLKETPFYAEKGGQVADIGTIDGEKARFAVKDCQAPFPGVILHVGKVEEGFFSVHDKATAHVDSARRQKIAAHHTATHLLHFALQEVLGAHIRQAGSLVAPDRLRFDFSHHKGVSPQEIEQIEDIVNEKIRGNGSVSTYEISFEEAQKRPEVKQFFGEKYGALVRVVDINSFSQELCGGTHAHHLGTLGLFRIIKESSIGSGIRRIEASVGAAAIAFIRSEEALMQEAANSLKIPVANLPDRIANLLEENLLMKQQLLSLKRGALKQLAQELAKKIEPVGKFPFLAEVPPIQNEDLLLLCDELAALVPSSILVLGLKSAESAQLLVKVSADLVSRGASAALLIKTIAPLIGGSGGGRAESAQAGGKKPEGILEALKTAREFVSKL